MLLFIVTLQNMDMHGMVNDVNVNQAFIKARFEFSNTVHINTSRIF